MPGIVIPVPPCKGPLGANLEYATSTPSKPIHVFLFTACKKVQTPKVYRVPAMPFDSLNCLSNGNQTEMMTMTSSQSSPALPFNIQIFNYHPSTWYMCGALDITDYISEASLCSYTNYVHSVRLNRVLLYRLVAKP